MTLQRYTIDNCTIWKILALENNDFWQYTTSAKVNDQIKHDTMERNAVSSEVVQFCAILLIMLLMSYITSASYRLQLGVKCTTGALLGMLGAIRRTLRLAANRRHSSIALTCGCRCTAALMWLLSLTLYKLTYLYPFLKCTATLSHLTKQPLQSRWHIESWWGRC